jgi:hypothetical protein
MHRQVGEAIIASAGGDDEHVAELASLPRSGCRRRRGSSHPLRDLAGDRATQLAHEEAVAHYERALQLLERCGRQDETRHRPLLLSLGFAQVRAGDLLPPRPRSSASSRSHGTRRPE